jgi:pilus assembly protein CpaC
MRRMRHLAALLLTVAAVVFLFRPVDGLADENNIEDQIVVVQNQIYIDIPYKFGNIAADAQLIKVIPLRDQQQILIAGRRSGSTNVLIYDRQGVLRDDFQVRVIPANLSKVMDKVTALLRDIEGLTFEIIGDQIYVHGEVATDDELLKVQDLADREKLVTNLSTLSPVAQRLQAGLIETAIDVPGVKARLINNTIIIEGVVHSGAASLRAEAIARAYYGNVVNVLEVREVERIPGRTTTVVIIVHFVQLSKELTSAWGFEWTPLAASPIDFFFSKDIIPSGPLSGQAVATVSAFLPNLYRARASGYARVLDNPTISVKSGEKASIFSGMEYPYLVSSGFFSHVEFKEIGIGLEVTPYAQGNDVDLDIKVTVTDLGQVAPNGFQAVDRAEIITSQYCRAGESIAIAGLQRIGDAVSYNKTPETGTTGALFNFYANKDYTKSKSQFLVFLTPQIHQSSSSANKEIKDQFNLQEVRQ